MRKKQKQKKNQPKGKATSFLQSSSSLLLFTRVQVNQKVMRATSRDEEQANESAIEMKQKNLTRSNAWQGINNKSNNEKKETK